MARVRPFLAALGLLVLVAPDVRPQDAPASAKPQEKPAPPKPQEKPPEKPKTKQDEERDRAKAEAEAKAKDPMSWDHKIRSHFRTYCYSCHGPEKKKGNVNLARDENPSLIAGNRKIWLTALDALEKGEMPPPKEKQPTEEHRKLMIEFVRKTLSTLDCDRPRDPGRPALRRLNRSEYDNTVLALTGLDLKLSDGFSPDPTGYGFDTISEVLSVSPVLVEQYHAAARRLLAELIDRKDAHPDAYRRVFFVRPAKDVDERQAARRVAERFATGAFRRPVDAGWIDKLLAIYDKARKRGDAHDVAVKPMLEAVLISPRFLMRVETTRPDAMAPYPVDDYDLASRLSYFLWSGPPDEELLRLAAEGKLGSGDVLEAQARRMLADPRSRELVENFFGQWLQLRGMATHAPDAKVFPTFTPSLRSAMRQEVDLFLGEVVRKDGPLTEVFDADYTYANEELAKHYGIEGVRGAEMRRVALPDRRRGGVLTSAAVLMLQSDPERTNIPRRGNYVAGSILGAAPPPPPPDVPALEESKTSGKELTLRQMLELHRSKPECASCHSRIDPLGFSLQNFDAIGRWRDQEGGVAIDASGRLPDGRAFAGPVELKKILLERRDEFTRTLTENLLIYALGRGLTPEDDCVVRDARKAATAAGHRFSSVVVAIVRSFPFRHRRNPDF